MSSSVFNKKCAGLLLGSISATEIPASIIQKTVTDSFLSKIMKDTFFPNLKIETALQLALNAKTLHWIPFYALVATSLLCVVFSIIYIIVSVKEYININIASSSPLIVISKSYYYKELKKPISSAVFCLIFNGVALLIAYYFRPGFLYTRIIDSLPINLYFLLVLNLAFGVFFLLYSVIAGASIKLIEEKSRSMLPPILSAIASALITLLIFCLLPGLICTMSAVVWFVILNTIVPIAAIAATTAIEKHYN